MQKTKLHYFKWMWFYLYLANLILGPSVGRWVAELLQFAAGSIWQIWFGSFCRSLGGRTAPVCCQPQIESQLSHCQQLYSGTAATDMWQCTPLRVIWVLKKNDNNLLWWFKEDHNLNFSVKWELSENLLFLSFPLSCEWKQASVTLSLDLQGFFFLYFNNVWFV